MRGGAGLSQGMAAALLAGAFGWPAAPLAAAGTPEVIALPPVLVTARRKEESAVAVPISMVALEGESLAEAGFSSATDLPERVAGLTVSVPNPRLTSFTIRGLGSNAFNDGVESSVGLFMDGVYLGRQGFSIFDLVDLERQLRACIQLNCVVPTIMLTMGTTDTFGVDQVKPVFELRNRLCEQFEVAVKPHIHVDAAIGWSMIFFLGYDFAANPLAINSATLAGIERNVARFAELKYADSFTVDFQKWGYVPYTSSLVMIKEQDDLKAMENDPENFSYFERDIQG